MFNALYTLRVFGPETEAKFFITGKTMTKSIFFAVALYIMSLLTEHPNGSTTFDANHIGTYIYFYCLIFRYFDCWNHWGIVPCCWPCYPCAISTSGRISRDIYVVAPTCESRTITSRAGSYRGEA